MQDAARRAGLGRLALAAYHRPVGLLRQSVKEGGPIEQHKTALGQAAMEDAAGSLPTLDLPAAEPDSEISFLTGPKFWHQTAFCFLSLQLVCPFRITPIIYSDGKLDKPTIDNLLRIVPWAKIVNTDESESAIDTRLPVQTFPHLRNRRREYPHLRKLIDLHITRRKFTLVADSDMLFYRSPRELIDWFGAPYPFFIQDVGTFYGYPLPFLNQLAGGSIPDRVNVGLYALQSHKIDWEQLEYWCRQQNDGLGPHYLQEQALTAMVLSQQSATTLSKTDYVVKPNWKEGQNPKAVLHHYVAESKRAYFQQGWQKIARLADGRANQ